MAFINEVFICTEQEVNAPRLNQSPAFRFPSVLCRDANTMRMSWLIRALHDKKGTAVSPADLNLWLKPGQVETPADYEIPHQWLHAIAGLCDEHLLEAASAWAAADIWEGCEITHDDLTELLLGMRQLARHALIARCRMYLSVSGAE